MIRSPSQYQLNASIENGDKITILKFTFYQKLILTLSDKLTQRKPVYLDYKGEKYDQRAIVIYTKEEMESYYEKRCNMEINHISLKGSILRPVAIFGNVNYIMINDGDKTLKFNYSDFKSLIDTISLRYERAMDGKELLYKETSRSQLSEFSTNSVIYKFKNGAGLDIRLLTNTKNNRVKICEEFLGIETEEYLMSNKKEKDKAIKEFEKILISRLEILLNNPLIETDLIIDKVNLGEDTSIDI